jgi:hypothetical protein
MLEGTRSGCINHPGVEALARCKQCGKPVCGTCVVSGPAGNFCSEVCKEKHQTFMSRAQQLDGRARGTMFVKLRKLAGGLIVLAAVCVAVGVIATAVEIPVLTDLVYRIRGLVGF